MSEHPIDVYILGPVLVTRNTRSTTPSSQQTRAIIGILALAGDVGLSADAFAESVWPRRTSPVSSNGVVVAVHRARRWLAEHARPGLSIERTASGYALRDAQTDVQQFVTLAAQPNRLVQALALWRGEPLADVAVGPQVATAVEALEDLRLTVAIRHGRQLLAEGRANEALPVLSPLADRHPLHESLHATLVEALASAGRQAEALERYGKLRTRLARDLGADPSTELSGALIRVLRQEIHAHRVDQTTAGTVAATTPVPTQLPPDIHPFVGRVTALAELDHLPPAEPGGSAVIGAVTGVAGVGKTALAVHWARAASTGFPDGQLYLNLRGSGMGAPASAPMRPIDALTRLLAALGVPAEQAPCELGEASALYRTLLAGRRMLVVLDDVLDADQVRPLLPGSAATMVLVTSRDRLAGLVARDGAARLELGRFTPDESTQLLTVLLGADRVSAESAAFADLIRSSRGLPRSLAIVARCLTSRPTLSIADYVRALTPRLTG